VSALEEFVSYRRCGEIYPVFSEGHGKFRKPSKSYGQTDGKGGFGVDRFKPSCADIMRFMLRAQGIAEANALKQD
jgi:hypothetical protein